MATEVATDPTRPTGIRWRVFSLAFATSVMLYLHRYAFAFIKPKLSEEWGLSNSELGAIDSAFSLCYSLFQFPIALIADVFGVHLVLTLLFVTWCGGLGMMAWAPTAGWMWSAQSLLGTGQSAVYACLSRIARTWFPPAVRTTLQGLVGIFAGRLGALGSSLLFTSLLLGTLGLSWRLALWVQFACGLILMVLFVWLFRNSPRQHADVNQAEINLIEGEDFEHSSSKAPTDRMTVWRMLSSVTPRSFLNLMFLCVQSILSTFADNVFSNWIPLFLFQVHHLEFKAMGVYAALPLLGGAIAGLLGGVLNDYLIVKTGNRRWSRVAVAFGGKSIAAVLLMLALTRYHDPYAFCVYLFFVKLFSDCSLTTAWGVFTDIGGRATASVFALTNAIAGIGMIAAPTIFGQVADHYGWRAVFVTVAGAYVLCAVSWLFIDCTVPVLLDRTEKLEPSIRSGHEPIQ